MWSYEVIKIFLSFKQVIMSSISNFVYEENTIGIKELNSYVLHFLWQTLITHNRDEISYQ